MKEELHNGVVVRAARSDDDGALARLDAGAWPIELQVVPPRPAGDPFFAGGRLVDDVLVATVGGVVAGYAHVARHLPVPANAHVLHLNAVVVDPVRRGFGLGRALLAAAVDEARRRGVRKLGLRVLSTNTTAQVLYAHAGFLEEGRLRDEVQLPDGRFVDDIWLALRVGPAIG